MRRPDCPECGNELKFEPPYWYCEACDAEYGQEEFDEEEIEDEKT